jgi:hypothetical protein
MPRGRKPSFTDHLTVQAVAAAVGATARRVQLWTDSEVLKCDGPVKPGTQGHHRTYSEDELPFAAIARALAKGRGVPIESLKRLTDFVRRELAGTRAEWCRAAWRGDEPSCILYRPEDDPKDDQFVWGRPWAIRDEHGKIVEQGMWNLAQMTDAVTVLNVQKVMRAIGQR